MFGFSPASWSLGWTPLHVAAENDQFDVAITLLRAGAGVDVAREDGATALHVAAGNGFADIVTLLLRKGADMEAVTRDRWYPLHMSCGNGHSAVTELLLRKGASVDATADAGTWWVVSLWSESSGAGTGTHGQGRDVHVSQE